MNETRSGDIQKLWDEYNSIVERATKLGNISHPVQFLCYEFSMILKRLSETNKVIFVHGKYCKEHDPDIIEVKKKADNMAQAIRDYLRSKRDMGKFGAMIRDSDSLFSALKEWEAEKT